MSHNWTAPTSGTITFSILNHKIASKGNDYGLDDISFGAIGQVIYPTSPSGKDVEVCMGLEMDEITFQASGHGTADPVFTASPAWITTSYIDGIFTLSGIPTTAGTFPYTIETTSPCGDTETISGVITVSEEISAGPDIATCSNVPVTMAGTLPVAVTGTWSGGTGSFDDASSPTAIYTIGAGDSGTVTLTYTDGSVVGSCKAFDTVDLIIAEMNAVSVIAPPSPTDCSDTTVDLLAVPLSEGTIGLWTVTSGQEVSNIGSYSFSDATSPTSTFTGMSGETYELTWTLSTPTTCTSSVPVTFAACPGISFDGVDDAVSFSNNFDALPNFSFEIWIKPNVSDGFTKTIFSKKDVNDPTKGYDLRYINDEISFYSNNKKVVSAAGVTPNRWYHIAVTFDGGDYVLYFDGMEMNNSESGAEPLANTAHFLLGGMYDSGRTPVNLFNGSVDELRIWGVALTKQQIREMMNQEIEDNGGVVYGSTIPIPVHDLSWSELHGYYQMNQGTDVSGGILAGMSGSQGSLLNMNSLTFQRESTPLPYTTSASGQWGTSNIWEGYQDLNPPNTLGVNGDVIYWNIVEIDDNVSSGDKDIIVSGLVVNSAGELIIMDPDFAEDENNPGRNLWVTNYLKLDGSIDLVGESQLLQKAYDQDQHYGSMLDPKSTGFIERDQQGIKNSFAYNYWSSPVSKIGGGVNNNLVMIEEILWDGTTTTPQAIDFGDDTDYYHADGVAGSSLKVASAWLWKLVNSPYSNTEWEFLGKNTKTISPTEGYTMKGTDAKGSVSLSTEYQNYVYRGRPNNAPFGVVGTSMLHTTFTANPTPFISLTGNPFPSALDADMFIEDNQNSTDKALYFWEHWSNGTHVWAKYQGGYAIRKVGNGVPAVSHPDLVAAGGPRNIPGAYVPVGQGFFVKSSAAGGGVVFKNSQRTFKREIGQGGASSVFIKGSKTKKNIDAKEVGKTMRIRLGFESPEGYHRQVLAAFFEGPTDGIDPLYDGRAGDLLPNDAFFIQEGENFVIQAFGEYREDREIPITVFIDENNNGGIQKFMIDDLENISDNVEIYIKDYYNDGETYDIRNTTFELPLESGEHKDRFALVFQSRLSKLGE
ncbi:MAG: LamG domain-containing protein, partial [Flavobacteriaceae bacterium]|nr:LamG domain-containing protein [Flavobacteriaceae bacterium]